MDRTHVYPTLAAALTTGGFDLATVERYGQLWDSIPPGDELLCPLCFTHADKRSTLKPLPPERGSESFRCEVCNATFLCPLRT